MRSLAKGEVLAGRAWLTRSDSAVAGLEEVEPMTGVVIAWAEATTVSLANCATIFWSLFSRLDCVASFVDASLLSPATISVGRGSTGSRFSGTDKPFTGGRGAASFCALDTGLLSGEGSSFDSTTSPGDKVSSCRCGLREEVRSMRGGCRDEVRIGGTIVCRGDGVSFTCGRVGEVAVRFAHNRFDRELGD